MKKQSLTLLLVVLSSLAVSSRAFAFERYNPFEDFFVQSTRGVHNIHTVVSVDRTAGTAVVRSSSFSQDITLSFKPGSRLPHPFPSASPISPNGADIMLEMLDAARQARSYVLAFTNMWWSTLSGSSTYYATPSTLGVIVNQQQGISTDNGLYYAYFLDPGEIDSSAPRSSVPEYYGYLYLRRSTTRYRWYQLLKNDLEMANHEKLRCRQIDGIPFNSTPHVGVLDIIKNVVLSREIDIGNTCRDQWDNKIVHNGSIW